MAGWAFLIILVVAAAGAVIGYQFKLVGDARTYIDVNSGDLAKDRTILGHTVSREVIATPFSQAVRQMGLAKPDPDWQQVLQFSWVSGTKTDFPMNGADAACAGAMWKVRNEKTDADKKQLLAQYMKLLEADNEKGMVALSQSVGVAQEKRLANRRKKDSNQ
jgi:hypothetical protein